MKGTADRQKGLRAERKTYRTADQQLDTEQLIDGWTSVVGSAVCRRDDHYHLSVADSAGIDGRGVGVIGVEDHRLIRRVNLSWNGVGSTRHHSGTDATDAVHAGTRHGHAGVMRMVMVMTRRERWMVTAAAAATTTTRRHVWMVTSGRHIGVVVTPTTNAAAASRHVGVVGMPERHVGVVMAAAAAAGR